MASDKDELRYDSCPVCGSTFKPWRSKLAGGHRYKMDLCYRCGYCFVNPRPSLDFLKDLYSTVGHGVGHSANDPPTLASIVEKERVFPNSTVDADQLCKSILGLVRPECPKRFLDVGCGYGFFTAEAIRAGFDVQALELATTERRIAQELTGITPIAASFEDFDCQAGSLGVVLMSQILEHALDVNLWIDKSRLLLAPNGVLAIALPNYGSLFRKLLQERDPYVCPPMHLNFFSPRSLSELLAKHGFVVERIQWVSRLPKSSFEKRMPRMARPAVPLVHLATRMSLRLIDALHLGMFIRVYGRKRSASKSLDPARKVAARNDE